MATVASPADEIQREMRQVRVELRDNVQEIVSGAREIADWKYYARMYPWLTVAAAAFVGYLVVPPRATVIRPDPEALLELAKHQQLSVHMEQPGQSPTSFMSRIAGVVTATAGQAALALASRQAQQFFESMQRSEHGLNHDQ